MNVWTARRPGVADGLTLGNAVCGMAAVVVVTGLGPLGSSPVDARYRLTCLLVVVGTILDMVDGAAARRWGGTSVGPFLDCLADAVTFGVAPVVAVLALPSTASGPEWVALAVGGTIYIVAALLRLADYSANRGTDIGFRGLPTTAASIAALALGFITTAPAVMGLGLLVVGVLMVGSFPCPAGMRLIALLLPAWALGACGLLGVLDVLVCAALAFLGICVVIPLGARVRTLATAGRPR